MRKSGRKARELAKMGDPTPNKAIRKMQKEKTRYGIRQAYEEIRENCVHREGCRGCPLAIHENHCILLDKLGHVRLPEDWKRIYLE